MAGSRKEYEMLFQLNAQLGNSYNSTFTKAQAEITSMQNQIQSLSKTQGDISAFQKQEAALDSARQKLALLQKQYENIQQEMSETAKCTSGLQKQASALDATRQKLALLQQQYEKIQQGMSENEKGSSAFKKQASALDETRQKLELLQQQYQSIQKEISATQQSSSALKNKLLEKQMQIDKTSASVETYEQKVAQMRESLRAAGIDTDNLSNENKRLASEIDHVKNRQQGVIDSMDESRESARYFGEESVAAIESIQQVLAAAGIAKLVQEIGEAMVECAKDSIAFESAITGVYKTVDGTDQQLAAIKGDIKDLATEIPATTEEIAAVAEAAGQLGIATDDVMDFTKVMIDLGESTNLTADEAASSLAKFSNITGTAASDYSRLGSVIVDLGNNFATTEADIVAMAMRLASSGKMAGLTEPQIMALATAMSSVGIEAEAGGTAMTQTLSAIEKAVAQGEEDLTKFAQIAGMSAEEFATAWESSPIQAVQSFIAGVGALDQKGESAVLVLEELGLTGIRQSNMLKSLGLAADTLTGAVDTANTAWNENIALSQEAGKRYATTESQLAMLDNSYTNLKVAIGDVYTPALREASEVGIDVLNDMTKFVEKNPEVIKLLTSITAGVAAFAASLGGYIVVSKAATVATAALTKAMDANPYLLATTAIVGVVTAVSALALTANNDAVPSVNDLTEAARDMNEVMDAAKETYDDTVTSTMAAANVANTYIDKLEELEAAGLNSSEEQKQYHNTLALLCQVVPDLASFIDLETDSIEGGTAALRDNTEAWKENAEKKAYQDQLTELYKSYAGVLLEAEKNSIGLTNAQNDLDAAEKKHSDTTERMGQLWNKAAAEADAYSKKTGALADPAAFLTQEYYDLQNSLYSVNNEITNAKDTVDNYQKAIEDGTNAVNAAEEEIALAEEAVKNLTGTTEENSVAQEENAAQIENVQKAITGVYTEAAALAEAYELAYTAAYESVTGQYDLWDKAADVVATSSETISTAMDSQITYWQDYNSNLQSLAERGQDIEGLSEMISSFADGSSESVNAIAGMASASDEDLASMVEDWKLLQAEQENVSKSIAELHTNFTQKMDELTQELEADIKEMDLSEEAAASGRNTIQGYINGSESMLPQVEAAYTRIAQRAMDAIDSTLDIHSPSREMAWRTEMTWDGYINQTRAMEPEVEKAMAEAANMGTEATDVQFMAFAPQLLSAISAQGTNAIEAQSVRSTTPAPIQVTIRVDGDATPETVETLNMYGEEFAERIRDILEETGIDAERRSY